MHSPVTLSFMCHCSSSTTSSMGPRNEHRHTHTHTHASRTPFDRDEAERAITNLLSRHVTDTLLCNTQHTTDVDWERGRAAYGCETVIFLCRVKDERLSARERAAEEHNCRRQQRKVENIENQSAICMDRRQKKRNVGSIAA